MQHHEQQVNESVDDNARGTAAGDGDQVVLRHPAPKSNGRLSQSVRTSSDRRRHRLQATSTTLDLEDLNNLGILDTGRNGVQHGRSVQSSDHSRPTLPLNGNDLVPVEKETTC